MADPISRPRSSPWWAPLGIAVLVLLVVAGSWSVFRSGSGSTPGSSANPPVLLLDGWAPTGSGTPDPRYRLADGTDLPDVSAQATVQRFLSPADGLRRELARTTGFAGAGTATDAGWTWSGGTGGPQLSIQKDGQWSFEVGSPSPPPTPRPVPAEKAVAMVAGLLRSLDLTDAHAAAPAAPTVVQASPTVGGRPTAGLVTTLSVGLAGMEQGAGWLVRSESGPAYPLVSARAAWDRLVRTPLPMPLIACPEPRTPGTDPVTCGEPITVTGARLGLALEQAQDGPLLVPAWLFTVDGSPQPLAEVAVAPRLVAPAGTGTGTSGTVVGGGTVTGGGGSSTGSGGGTVIGDGSGSSGATVPPVAPESRFSSVRAAGSALDLRFWGGVDSCFSYEVRVTETSSAVRLRLVEHRVAGVQVCPDLAMEHQQRVALGGSLGRRTVVDADSGTVLLRP